MTHGGARMLGPLQWVPFSSHSLQDLDPGGYVSCGPIFPRDLSYTVLALSLTTSNIISKCSTHLMEDKEEYHGQDDTI